MQIAKQDILNDIKRIPNGIHREIMSIIVEYLYEYDFVDEVNISDIAEITDNKYRTEDILLSLQQLCLLKYPALKAEYYFYENDNERWIPLTKKDVKEARKSGYLEHPKTGINLPLDIYDKNIFLNFEPIIER